MIYPMQPNTSDFIAYADDTSFYRKIQAPVTSPIDINDEISGVYNW